MCIKANAVPQQRFFIVVVLYVNIALEELALVSSLMQEESLRAVLKLSSLITVKKHYKKKSINFPPHNKILSQSIFGC